MSDKVSHLKSENRVDLWRHVPLDDLHLRAESYSVTSHYTPEVKIFQDLECAETYFNELVKKYTEASSVKAATTPNLNAETCISCGRSFEIGDGYVGADVSICDVCNGD